MSLPRVLEAYMDEVVWPHPPEAERHSLYGHWPNVKHSCLVWFRLL